MTISNILHVNGSKADLYSSSYFKRDSDVREPVNPFKQWVDGCLYAYGTVTNSFGTFRAVINLTAAKGTLEITADSDDPMQEIEDCLNKYDYDEELSAFAEVNPPVPPSNICINWSYKNYRKEYQGPLPTSNGWTVYSAYGDFYVDSENTTIKPALSTDETARAFIAYYYNDQWNFSSKVNAFISIDCSVGDNLTERIETIKAELITKFPSKQAEITKLLKLYSADIRKADHVDGNTYKDASLMGYWLGKYEEYPKIYSVDQESDIIATFGNHLEPNMDGDFEYRHSLPDAVFDFKSDLVNRSTTLPICNGLLCYPRLVEGRIYASQGQRLSYNKKDRNRRWVLVDFNPVGGCKFIQLKNLKGSLSCMHLDDFDKTTQSVLLVVNGRLFMPRSDFFVDDNNDLQFSTYKYLPIYELDRKLCRGDLRWNTQTIEKNGGVLMTETVENTEPETIYVYNETKDKKFLAGRTYFVERFGDYIKVDVSGLIGQTINSTTVGYSGHELGLDTSEWFGKFYNLIETSVCCNFYSKYNEATGKTFWYPSKTVSFEATGNREDLMQADNSFVIIINKPNLQIYHHKSYQGSQPITKMKWGVDTFAPTMKMDFDQQARGLLFDETTRSVYDYTRETQTMTFYVDTLRKWGVSTVTTNWQSPISMTDESEGTIMNARGFVLNHTRSDKYDYVNWSRMSILDFVFRG